MSELIGLSAAASRLGIHVTTLRGWVREGRIPSYRVGQRFVRVDMLEVLRAVACGARAPSTPASRSEATTLSKSLAFVTGAGACVDTAPQAGTVDPGRLS